MANVGALYRIQSPQPTATNVTVITFMRVASSHYANLGVNPSTGASEQMGEI